MTYGASPAASTNHGAEMVDKYVRPGRALGQAHGPSVRDIDRGQQDEAHLRLRSEFSFTLTGRAIRGTST